MFHITGKADPAILNTAWVMSGLVFISLFFVMGFSFPLNAPSLYFFRSEALEYFFCRTTYLLFIVQLALLLTPWRKLLNQYKNPLFWWGVFFIGIIALSLMQGRKKIDYSLLNLMLFLYPPTLIKHQKPLILAIAIAISINALYSIAGMIASTQQWSYDIFPIIPYKWDGKIQGEVGFYSAFSPALFYQTNAAGAIFATSFAFFLFRFLVNASDKTVTKFALAFSFIGLFLSRSLAPILLTLLCTLWVLPIPYRRWAIYAVLPYLTWVTFSNEGIFGLNLDYLVHKIHTSASVKLSLLAENWTYLTTRGWLNLLLPTEPDNWGTENSFIDTAFQYGLIPTILFYIYCARNFMLIGRREGLLLLFPLLLSLIQNSALTSPSVMILGLSLGLYGKSLSERMANASHTYKQSNPIADI